MLKLKKIIIAILAVLMLIPTLAACGDKPDERPNIPIGDGFEGVFAGTIEYVSFEVVVTINGDGTGSFIYGTVIDDGFTYEVDESDNINVTLDNDPETWEGAQSFTLNAVSEDLMRLSYFGIAVELARKSADYVPTPAPDAGPYAALEGTFTGTFWLLGTKEAILILHGNGYSEMKFGSQDWRRSIYSIKSNGEDGYTMSVLEEDEHDKITGTVNSADEIKAKYSAVSITFARQNV